MVEHAIGWWNGPSWFSTLQRPGYSSGLSSGRLGLPVPLASRIRHRKIILVVDDDLKFFEEARFALAPVRAQGILFACTGKRAMELLHQLQHEIAIVLVDLNLPDVNVLELIREMRREWPKLPIMAVSAYGDDAEVLGDVVKMLGADKMIVKPLAADKWAEIVRRARRFREAGGTALPDF